MKRTHSRWLSGLLKHPGRNRITLLRSPLLLTTYSLAFIFLGLTVLASLHTGIPIAVFVRDPVIVMDGSPIIGVQSNLGVLIWLASASVCFFCYALLRRNVSSPANDRLHRQGPLPQRGADFFLWSGMITLWLTLDDMFLFHEYLPEIVPSISQASIYAVYGLFVAWHMVRFRQYMLQSSASLLGLAALFFLGLSVFSDIVQDVWDSPWRIFFEDGFKLLGIVSWSSYLIGTGFQVLKQRLTEKAFS